MIRNLMRDPFDEIINALAIKAGFSYHRVLAVLLVR
jgi:hypothetical protein